MAIPGLHISFCNLPVSYSKLVLSKTALFSDCTCTHHHDNNIAARPLSLLPASPTYTTRHRLASTYQASRLLPLNPSSSMSIPPHYFYMDSAAASDSDLPRDTLAELQRIGDAQKVTCQVGSVVSLRTQSLIRCSQHAARQADANKRSPPPWNALPMPMSAVPPP